MNKVFARFVKDESGATAIEYGLIAALIAVAIIGAVSAVGGSLTDRFNAISSAIDNPESAG
ncbi:Flp family type IVb pilin [Notoacmeibacter ruber]|uniref:Flp family type IVb pilin n=1 Tax=Notoacmeibacter ruber TaxID=2670375 RepID=A0A3L7JF78_9HYPH|nr:Flp family type IVb pilin [Notoacmeibacter ruber]RLQ89313.1 Flp family type IVb pilin [Notoacmeibacter ruber]